MSLSRALVLCLLLSLAYAQSAESTGQKEGGRVFGYLVLTLVVIAMIGIVYCYCGSCRRRRARQPFVEQFGPLEWNETSMSIQRENHKNAFAWSGNWIGTAHDGTVPDHDQSRDENSSDEMKLDMEFIAKSRDVWNITGTGHDGLGKFKLQGTLNPLDQNATSCELTKSYPENQTYMDRTHYTGHWDPQQFQLVGTWSVHSQKGTWQMHRVADVSETESGTGFPDRKHIHLPRPIKYTGLSGIHDDASDGHQMEEFLRLPVDSPLVPMPSAPSELYAPLENVSTDVCSIPRMSNVNNHYNDHIKMSLRSVLLKRDPRDRHLNLANRELNDDDMEHLSNFLQSDTTLTSLYLGYNKIGAVGASALAKSLFVNTTLTSLNLYYNQIGAVGASALAKSLVMNTRLTSLILYGNQIGDVGASALAKSLVVNTSLTSLNIGYNRIGAIGASALAKSLVMNTSLTSLDLSGNQIGVVGASALAKSLVMNTSLTSLNLGNNQIGAVGASVLAKSLVVNTALTSLDLSINRIGAVGASALAKSLTTNSVLTSLNLCQNRIGAVGASALSKSLVVNTSLTSLDLCGNQIGAVGACAFAKSLTANSVLTSLDLSVNRIGDVGACALAKSLFVNTTMISLDLGYNQIGNVGVGRLAKSLQSNTRLTILGLARVKRVGNVECLRRHSLIRVVCKEL